MDVNRLNCRGSTSGFIGWGVAFIRTAGFNFTNDVQDLFGSATMTSTLNQSSGDCVNDSIGSRGKMKMAHEVSCLHWFPLHPPPPFIFTFSVIYLWWLSITSWLWLWNMAADKFPVLATKTWYVQVLTIHWIIRSSPCWATQTNLILCFYGL